MRALEEIGRFERVDEYPVPVGFLNSKYVPVPSVSAGPRVDESMMLFSGAESAAEEVSTSSPEGSAAHAATAPHIPITTTARVETFMSFRLPWRMDSSATVGGGQGARTKISARHEPRI
jgi:hypothetical protein